MFHLNEFERPRLMFDQQGVVGVFGNGRLQHGIAGLVQRDAGKQIVDERQEQRFVLIDQLGQIHIAQNSHDDGGLRVCRTGTFGSAQCT